MKKKNQVKMHQNAQPYTFLNASINRLNMTEAEKIFWLAVKDNQLGYKIRRQHPIGEFIVDFYCHQLKLVIEIDGGYHQLPDVKHYDRYRTYELERTGLRLVRFPNAEIINNLTLVLKSLKTEFDKISSTL